ncbi:hypothetical protein ACOSQ4_019030 [Xanthoceras sorbifolium]
MVSRSLLLIFNILSSSPSKLSYFNFTSQEKIHFCTPYKTFLFFQQLKTHFVSIQFHQNPSISSRNAITRYEHFCYGNTKLRMILFFQLCSLFALCCCGLFDACCVAGVELEPE